MKIQIKKMPLIDTAFYVLWAFFSIGYFVLSGSELWYMYSLGTYMSFITYGTIMGLAVLFVLKQNYSLKVIATYSAFILMVAFIEISSSDKTFLVYILFIMMAQFIDFEKFVKFDLKLRIAIYALIILLFLLGVINNYTLSEGGQIKQSFGFSHPNKFACYSFTVLAEWIYVRFYKIKKIEYVVILLSVIFIISNNSGRTTIYTFVLICVLFAMAKIKPEIFYSKISHFMFIIITPLCAIISFVLTNQYMKGSLFAVQLDEFLTHRLRFQSYFLTRYDLNLFGQNIELVSTRMSIITGQQRAILDNAYIRSAFVYGVVYLVFICVVYSIMFHKFLKAKHVELAIFGLFFVLYGLGESYMLNAVYNVTLLCFLGMDKLTPREDIKHKGKKYKIRWN